ncbi:hypothetical protein [Luteimonas sp. MC1825]|uniref:hypothetical protein n=1 Tax=Luteimonas sp. MC1825 TaxID=2761107 RepID=UPI00161D0FEB|nr:hypothetical protein [Luteimonas sp. MC1825]MBB6600652.1 hypothetical protein [Luteimonas sp. MC1825]QOC88250.1 hypothetical protein IDM46_00250 [Luteimonas sp. MC1825]
MSKELAALTIWLFVGYFGTGVRKAMNDLSQPLHNQPGYMHRSRLLGALFAVFCWPVVWLAIWSTSRRLGMKRTPGMKSQLPVLSSFVAAAVIAIALYFLR